MDLRHLAAVNHCNLPCNAIQEGSILASSRNSESILCSGSYGKPIKTRYKDAQPAKQCDMLQNPSGYS
jgi:hypothetical protein